MTRYTSGDKLNLKIGIESYSENLTSLEVIGTAEIDGDINVSAGNSITAPEYYGDGSNLTGITLNQVSDAIGGITVQEEGVDVGTTNGITNINFVSGNLTATGSGIGATITLTDTPSFTTITGNLTGTATTATNADNIEVNQNTGNTFKNVVFVNGTDGNLKPQVNTSIQVQPSTGILTASEFHGDGSNLTGLSAGQVGAMADLVSDIDPELGGDLDLNNNDITGTGNINITGVITATSFSGDITGTATTATQIETSRNFSVSGDVATASNVSFDGTGNVDLAVTLSNNFSANTTGIITASEFYGDGSNLTGLSAGQVGALAGVTIRDEDVVEGSVGGVGDINFVGNYITATASGAGATITLSDISLGTDTTGNYVESISGTANEIQISNGSGEGSTPQIGLPNNVTISNNLSVSGNLNVTGTLTYEDVTNVDSIGIVTARSGIDAEGDINVSAGNSITAPKYYGDGSNLTGLSAGQVGAMADLVSDIDPELGGDLDLNNFDITGTGNVNINGSITATSFSGDGSGVTGVITATNADNIEVNQNTGNTFKNVVFVNGIDGNLKPQVISSIQVQASSGILTATKLSGDGSLITGLSATQVGAMTDLVSDIDPELGGDLDLNNNDITGTGNINITGVITATSFSGDGSNLTGLSAGQVGAMTDLVSDIDPELGGDLDLNNFDIEGTGNINITGVITATSFDGTLATSDLSGTITNAQLAGSIANSKLVNSSVSFGGVSVNLGGSNAQPAFDLTNATNYPYSSLTGTPTIPTDNDQLTNGAGYITSFDITTQTDPKYLRSDANDVYTGTLTGAGNISFSGTKIEIGDGSGSVAMTINDGYGNANLCFNHAAGRPDVNGNALRIETNVDSTTNANFVFEGKSNVTANTATALNQLFTMSETGATCLGNTVWHAGNDGSGSGLDADKLDDQEGSYYLDYNNFTNTPTIPTNNNVLTNGAGFITSSDNITGTASTATTITISSNNDSTAYRVPYTSSNSGNVSLYVDNSDGMTYNPGTNTLSAGSFSGDGSNLTGVVKTTGVQTIAGIKTFTDDVYVDGLSAISIGVTLLTATSITGDLSGNVTGNVTGTATTATNADNIEVDVNSNTTFRNIVTVIGTDGYRKPQVNTSIQAQLSSGTIKATVFSGSGASLTDIPYSSLTGTPTIPTNNNQLTNGAGYITSSGSITGNAATATTLQTARSIGGTSFNGSADITPFRVNTIATVDAGTLRSSYTTYAVRNAASVPNNYGYGVNWEFKNASVVSGNGNYAGLLTLAPWVGTTASTGDPSYQLAFSPAAANSTSAPTLKLRAGIDTTWGDWSTIYHSGNDGSNSGLDADTVDGIQGSALAPIASPTFTGNLTIPNSIVHTGDTNTYIQFHGNDLFRVVIAGAEVQEWGNNYTLLSDNDTLRLGTSSDFRMVFDGADTVFRNYAHTDGDIIFQGENSSGTNQNIFIMKTDSTRTYNILYENSQERLRTTSGGVTVTGNIAVTGTVDGRDIAADGTKLDGIATGATNVTNNNQLTNGAGYITDITTQTDPKYLRSNANDTFTGTITGNTLLLGGSQITTSSAKLQVNGFMRTGNIVLHEGGNTPTQGADGTISNTSGTLQWEGNQVWTSANDGSGSGLDADTLDGLQASSFLRSDANNSSATGNIITSNQICAGQGTGSVALTLNDGYGNANLTFNHRSGVPDISGSSGRIECAVDSTSAAMYFELGDSSTANTARSLTTVMDLTSSAINLRQNTTTYGTLTALGNVIIDNDADLLVGDGAANERILIKKADNNVSDHIQFYNGTTRIGEIGCQDTTWLRINQVTNKNIYTPRYIRADGGFFVDGTSKGINGSGNFFGGTIAGASDYGLLMTLAGSQTVTGSKTFNDNVRLNFGTANSHALRRDTTNLILDIPNGGTFFIRDTSGTAAIKHSFAVNGNYISQGTVTANLFSGSGASLTNIPAGQLTGTINDARLPNSISSDITGNAATVSVTSITSGATERPVYFNDGTTTSGNGVLRMDGSANGMRYRADQNRLLLSNLTVANAVTGDLNGNASTATLASNVDVSSITSGATERRVYFNDGSTSNGSNVVRMDGSANGMRYRADQNRLILSNLTVVNAVSGNLNGNATTAGTATLASTVTVSSTNANSNHRVALTDGTGSKAILSDGQLLYNPATDVLTSGTFSGSGASLTSLNASNISSGTIADARLPGTITSNITGSSASCTGNAATATTASNVSITGSGNTTNIRYLFMSTGTSGTSPTIVDGDLKYTPSNNTLTAGVFSGSGASLTNLNASNISSGTINDARLPATISSNITGSSASCTGNAATATVANGLNTSASGANAARPVVVVNGTTPQTSSGGVTINVGTGKLFAVNFQGGGASLTDLNASNISSGTISDARLPATISSDITGTSTGCEDSGILSLLSTAQAVQIRGNPSSNLSRVYRFGKPNANSTEVFFNLNNITADRTFTWPDAGGTIATTSSSDRRLKTNISNITSQSALDFVNNISPVTFDWKTDIHNGQSHAHSQSAGYIAQQLVAAGYSYMLDTTPMEEDFIEKELYFTHDKTEVDPETGVNNPEDSYYTMNYELATPFLHKALADALTKIDELQARIVALESN